MNVGVPQRTTDRVSNEIGMTFDISCSNTQIWMIQLQATIIKFFMYLMQQVKFICKGNGSNSWQLQSVKFSRRFQSSSKNMMNACDVQQQNISVMRPKRHCGRIELHHVVSKYFCNLCSLCSVTTCDACLLCLAD